MALDTKLLKEFNWNMPDQGYLTEKDFDEIEQRLREIFPTKGEFTQYRSDLMNKLDQILKMSA